MLLRLKVVSLKCLLDSLIDDIECLSLLIAVSLYLYFYVFDSLDWRVAIDDLIGFESGCVFSVLRIIELVEPFCLSFVTDVFLSTLLESFSEEVRLASILLVSAGFPFALVHLFVVEYDAVYVVCVYSGCDSLFYEAWIHE